jgi:hypothetical protein
MAARAEEGSGESNGDVVEVAPAYLGFGLKIP